MLLRFFHHNNDLFWFGIIAIIILIALGLVVFAIALLSKGYLFYYIKAKIHNTIKQIFVLIQFLGSLLLALVLPNNYLNEYPVINDYYEKNGLWIVASFALLFLIFVLSFGIIFGLLARLYTKETIEFEEEEEIL